MIFSDIRTYAADLESMEIRSVGDLHDRKNFYAVSMILFSLLNRVFDLGSEIVMARNLGIPGTYREIFVRLEKDGLIDPDLANRMIRMAASRNLLSHEYHGITEEQLFALLKDAGHIQAFVRRMQDIIRTAE